MPRRGTGEYPPGWKEFADSVKEAAGWVCCRCGHGHDPAAGYCLTVHHATMAKDEPYDHWWAFLPLCQRCHLSVQARVNLDRPYVMGEHSAWFKPYVAGFYAWKYLGVVVPRAVVEEHLAVLLDLERAAVIDGMGCDALRERFRFFLAYAEELDRLAAAGEG